MEKKQQNDKVRFGFEGEVNVGVNFYIEGVHRDLCNALMGVMVDSPEFVKVIEASLEVYKEVKKKGEESK